MTLGPSTAAPAGYVDFCRRQPLDCGADAAQAEAAAQLAQANRAVAPATVTHVADVSETSQPKLGPGLWRRLNDVNARVNRAIRPQTDVAQFGQADYWQTPIEAGRPSGDCEDYALEKMRALLAAGVPRSALNLALAVIPTGEVHAVLVVTTADGDFVLDNLSGSVARWDATPYRWLSRQVAGQAFDWALVVPARG